MTKIYTPEELGKLNDQMLQRGAPVEKDDIGYNQCDFQPCSKIFGTPDPTQCHTLANVLIKYCKTQLNVDTDDMKATLNQYSKYEQGKYLRPVKHDSKGVWLHWGYNMEFNNAIKEAGKPIYDAYRFEKTTDQGVVVWICRLGYHCMEAMLKALESKGAYTEDVKGYLATLPTDVTNPVVVEAPQVTTEAPNKPVIIKVERSDTDRLCLRFNKCDAIRLSIKALPQWKFEKTDKADKNKADPHWVIDLDEAVSLYNTLKDIKNINASELKYWADRMTSTPVCKLKDFSYLKRQPRVSQIEGANRILNEKKLICGDEMGVGKTFECVIAGESIPMPKLVVCPPSLRLNWEREIKMVNPKADVRVIYNDLSFKMGKDWTVVGYPSLSEHRDMIEECEFRVMFVDEAHFCKAINNSGKPDSQRAEFVQYLAKTAEYIIPITGTPVPNKAKDLYNILRLIKHNLADTWNSWHGYTRRFCDAKHNGFGWDFEGNSNEEELHEAIKPQLLRRLKKEVLPDIEKIRSFIPVQVDLREYNRIIDEYMDEYNKRKGTVAEHLARVNRARMVLAIGKAQATTEFVKDFLEYGKKVVIMTNYTEVVNKCKTAFGNRAVTVVGGMSDSDKQAAIDRFQTGDAEVIICNLIAGGVGITLTASYNMVMNDYDWVPANHVQGEDRIARGGQVKRYSNIFYMYAVGADIDEMFTEVLQYKLDMINAIVDGGTGENIDLKSLVFDMLNSKSKGGKSFSADVERYTAPAKKESEPKVGVKSGGKAEVKKQVETKKDQPKVIPAGCPTDKEIKKMSNEEVFIWAKSLGAAWKECDHTPINRMRAIMAAKKVLGA